MKILEVLENKKQISTQKIKLIESTPDLTRRTFPVGSLFPLNSNMTVWGIGLDSTDDIIEFDSKASAEKFLSDAGDDAKDASKLRSLARGAGGTIRDISGISQRLGSLTQRASFGTFAALEAIKTSNKFVGPTLAKVLTSPWWRGFGKIVAAVGTPAMIVWTNVGIINELEQEAQSDPNKVEENKELRDIIIAQTGAQILFYLIFVFRNASLLNKALRAIKWTVRAALGAAAVSGVGTIPGVLGLLVTEAGWLIAGFIISSPAVQRALAEYIQGSMMSVFFEGAGQLISGAATVLDSALDGRFGSGALRRGLGWDNQEAEAAPEGEMTTNSEWAKLVFHGLLFPPGKEQMLVPYINPEQRGRLLNQALGLDVVNDQQPADNEQLEQPEQQLN